MRAALLLLLLSCSPAQQGTWQRPDPSRLAPDASYPLDAVKVHADRVALAVPDVTLLHQVAVDAPDRSDVMIGRLRFPTPDSYTLTAQAAVGMRLFTVGYTPDGGVHTDVAGPLQGRFPAEVLARDIARVYLAGCDSAPTPTAGAYELTCIVDGAEITERLDGRTLAPLARRVVEDDGRTLDITYSEYGWWGPAWHPRRIQLASDTFQVEILLSGVSTATAR